jgi:hypothetical protein
MVMAVGIVHTSFVSERLSPFWHGVMEVPYIDSTSMTAA